MTYNTLRVALEVMWMMIWKHFPVDLPSAQLEIIINGPSDDKANLWGQLHGDLVGKSKE